MARTKRSRFSVLRYGVLFCIIIALIAAFWVTKKKPHPERSPLFTTQLSQCFNPAKSSIVDAYSYDYDNDGKGDILLTSLQMVPGADTIPTPIRVLRNNGNGKFIETTAAAGLANVTAMHPRNRFLADFNGDGLMDALIADHGTDHEPFPGGFTKLLIAKPGGKLADETKQRLQLEKMFTFDVSAGDIDGDGDVDIYMGNTNTTVPVFLINDGKGYFKKDFSRLQEKKVFWDSGLLGSALADVDNDGDLDLIQGCDHNIDGVVDTTRDFLALNDGHGFFKLAPRSALPKRYKNDSWGTIGVYPRDFDKDGWVDLMMLVHNSDNTEGGMQLFINNRDGTFSEAKDAFSYAHDSRAKSWLPLASIGDLNGDGLDDVVTFVRANAEIKKRVYVFLNKGHGHFEDVTDRTGIRGQGVAGVALLDSNNDKRLDIVVVRYDGQCEIAVNSGN